MESGTYVYNSSKGKKERVGRMMEMHANSREDRKVARAGDIVAIGGLKDTITGETLCAEGSPVILEKMDFPEPVIKVRFFLFLFPRVLVGYVPVDRGLLEFLGVVFRFSCS